MVNVVQIKQVETPEEWESVKRLRVRVFVCEQGVPLAEEFDDTTRPPSTSQSFTTAWQSARPRVQTAHGRDAHRPHGGREVQAAQ